jgi:hypothetical protein
VTTTRTVAFGAAHDSRFVHPSLVGQTALLARERGHTETLGVIRPRIPLARPHAVATLSFIA